MDWKKQLKRWLPLAVIIFALFNPYYNSSLKEMEKVSGQSVESLALIEELYLFAKAAGSVKLPIISGTFEGAANSLESVSQYLLISTSAILVNTMLLKITHYKLLLFLFFVVWLGTFFNPFKQKATQLLLILLLINPGLSLFTQSVLYLDHTLKVTNKDQLHEELQQIHHDFVKREEAREKKHADRKKRHLAKVESRKDRREARRELRRGEPVTVPSDSTTDDTMSIQNDTTDLLSSEHSGLHLAEDFKQTKVAIRFAAKKVKGLVTNFFTAIIFLHIILPLGFLALLYLVTKTYLPNLLGEVKTKVEKKPD